MLVLQSEAVIGALRDATRRGAGRQALLQLTADTIQSSGSPYTGVYLYMLHGDILELEAFAGDPTEQTTIPVGKGICGRAVQEARDLNVADVHADAEYLACSLTTRSELICLLTRADVIVGQIDIDSDVPEAFPPAEQRAVRAVADALQELL